MHTLQIWLLLGISVYHTEAKDIVCGKKTKEKVFIGDGDSFTFKTQAGPTYAPKTRCIVTYKKLSTCQEIRFSCSQFNIANKKASCKGKDKMVIKKQGQNTNYCQTTGPDITTDGNLKISFLSNKKIQASGALCEVECVSDTTTTTITTIDTTTTDAATSTGSGPAELKNDELCGITGGQAECYFDCDITSSVQGSGQLIKDLTCLEDCFSSQESVTDYCITSLLNDVISKGVCNLTDEFGYNPGPEIYKEVECVMGAIPSQYGFDQTVVDKGTCSAETENLLLNEECRREIMEEQGFIQNTLLQLIQNSCNHNVSEYYVDFMQGNLPGGRKKRDAESFNSEEAQLHARVKRLAPAQAIYGSDGIRTKLEFENTKNRYSWICSLRSSGSTPEHLCAVNLLSLPPNPAVLVGAAHCTYLCRDADEGQVSPCCCSSGPDNCAGNTTLCGNNPGVAEMDGTDATIVCGEWQTKRNDDDDDELALDILEIIRHPSYNHAVGPISGNDIAVFKVKDTPLENRQSHNLHPACLPEQKNSASSSGIHAGWSKPPPLSFINNHAKEYAQFHDDFFKQWHYKMDILEKCEDPTTTSITGGPLTFPSNSSYPAGTICAKDFSKQSCFSTGDSGSPLMVQGGDKSLFSIEGILSFVKGCDVFSFGTTNSAKNNAQLNQQSENPSTYTKLSCFLPWIAEQYGMVYGGGEDPSCSEASGNPDDGDEPCRITPSNLVELFTGEVECIFPYYYKGTLYDGCILFEEDGFVYPIFRCPTRNITTKIDGINSFEFLPLVDGYCPEDSSDPTSPLNPNKTDCSPFSRRAPFSQCKNNCPGVQAFGIIGGGTALMEQGGVEEEGWYEHLSRHGGPGNGWQGHGGKGHGEKGHGEKGHGEKGHRGTGHGGTGHGGPGNGGPGNGWPGHGGLGNGWPGNGGPGNDWQGHGGQENGRQTYCGRDGMWG